MSWADVRHHYEENDPPDCQGCGDSGRAQCIKWLEHEAACDDWERGMKWADAVDDDGMPYHYPYNDAPSPPEPKCCKEVPCDCPSGKRQWGGRRANA